MASWPGGGGHNVSSTRRGRRDALGELAAGASNHEGQQRVYGTPSATGRERTGMQSRKKPADEEEPVVDPETMEGTILV